MSEPDDYDQEAWCDAADHAYQQAKDDKLAHDTEPCGPPDIDPCPNCDGTGHEAASMSPAGWYSPVEYATCVFCQGSGEAK
jgi:hypothetical protein